jgi:hypothetical protein
MSKLNEAFGVIALAVGTAVMIVLGVIGLCLVSTFAGWLVAWIVSWNWFGVADLVVTGASALGLHISVSVLPAIGAAIGFFVGLVRRVFPSSLDVNVKGASV